MVSLRNISRVLGIEFADRFINSSKVCCKCHFLVNMLISLCFSISRSVKCKSTKITVNKKDDLR